MPSFLSPYGLNVKSWLRWAASWQAKFRDHQLPILLPTLCLHSHISWVMMSPAWYLAKLSAASQISVRLHSIRSLVDIWLIWPQSEDFSRQCALRWPYAATSHVQAYLCCTSWRMSSTLITLDATGSHQGQSLVLSPLILASSIESLVAWRLFLPLLGVEPSIALSQDPTRGASGKDFPRIQHLIQRAVSHSSAVCDLI